MPWQASLCGAVAGGFSAAVTTPLDVAKTRIMLAKVVTPLGLSWFLDQLCFSGGYLRSQSRNIRNDEVSIVPFKVSTRWYGQMYLQVCSGWKGRVWPICGCFTESHLDFHRWELSNISMAFSCRWSRVFRSLRESQVCVILVKVDFMWISHFWQIFSGFSLHSSWDLIMKWCYFV